MTDNNLPTTPANERLCISSIIAHGQEWLAEAVQWGLESQHFHDPINQVAYRELLGLHAENKPIGLDTIWERVRRANSEISPSTFVELTRDPLPTSATWAGVVEEIIDKAQRRSLIAKAADIAAAAATSPADELARKMSKLMEGTSRSKVQSTKDIAAKARTKANAMLDGSYNPAANSIEWAWPDMNKFFKPMRRGELVVLAARPSVGKSSMARQQVSYAATNLNINCALFTYEMPVGDVLELMAGGLARVNPEQLPKATKEVQSSYFDALKQLESSNLLLSEYDSSLSQIVVRVRSMAAQKPVDLVCIDYLGLIKDCSNVAKNATKAQAVGAVTGALKRLALEQQCVVLLLAQLNRSAAINDRQPTLSDLRDSGDIEQDADRVIFIHRKDQTSVHETTETHPEFEMLIIQDKGRSVGTGFSPMMFHRDTATFRSFVKPEAKFSNADKETPF